MERWLLTIIILYITDLYRDYTRLISIIDLHAQGTLIQISIHAHARPCSVCMHVHARPALRPRTPILAYSHARARPARPRTPAARRKTSAPQICTTACGNAGKFNFWRVVHLIASTNNAWHIPGFTLAGVEYSDECCTFSIHMILIYIPSEFIANWISRLREHDREQRASTHKLWRAPHNLRCQS